MIYPDEYPSSSSRSKRYPYVIAQPKNKIQLIIKAGIQILPRPIIAANDGVELPRTSVSPNTKSPKKPITTPIPKIRSIHIDGID